LGFDLANLDHSTSSLERLLAFLNRETKEHEEFGHSENSLSLSQPAASFLEFDSAVRI